MNNKQIVGRAETCALPDLGINSIAVRIDTGAKTSSVHADNLEEFKKDGERWVRFEIHPSVHNVEEVINCEARLHGKRRVKSSNGQTERRYLIKTTLCLGDDQWEIDLTLTDRTSMKYPMLLGRQGMMDKILVNPSAAYLVSKN